jgi:hypothetical protein
MIIQVSKTRFRRDMGGGQKNEVSVWAYPFIPCFACTVHKVQGCTITQPLLINTTHMDWVNGSFYVAVSRANSHDQIFLQNYQHKFTCHPRAQSFYLNGNCIQCTNEKECQKRYRLSVEDIKTLEKEGAFLWQQRAS